MKRLCFYCFWVTDYSRLIRRYVAKDYYALSDDELLSVPFFVSSTTLDRKSLMLRLFKRNIPEDKKGHVERPGA